MPINMIEDNGTIEIESEKFYIKTVNTTSGKTIGLLYLLAERVDTDGPYIGLTQSTIDDLKQAMVEIENIVEEKNE